MRHDGRITAVELRVPQRGGAHSGYGVVTNLYAGSMLYAIYDLHNVKYIGKRVLTNTPPLGAFEAMAPSTSALRREPDRSDGGRNRHRSARCTLLQASAAPRKLVNWTGQLDRDCQDQARFRWLDRPLSAPPTSA